MLNLSPEEFEELVRTAMDGLPEGFRKELEAVALVIEARPARELLLDMEMDPEEETLFGLYQGLPLPEQSLDDVGRLPAKITIFREPLLEASRSREELVEEVQVTVVHEFAHHFGIDEDHLEDLGWG